MMYKNTQQPVAWIDDDGMVFWKDGIPPDGTDLYTAPPVPRDVLMAFGEAVRDAAKRADFDIGEDVDIAAIADRYASKVQPDPVNQQLLAVARSIIVPDMIDLLPPEYVAKVQAAIAASEAAQPVAPVKWQNECDKQVPAALRYLADHDRPYGGEQRFNSAHLYQLADEIEIMAQQPLYAKQPASVQPVAVPDGLVRATELAAAAIYLADSSDYLSALWGILRFLSPDIASLAESDTRAAWERAEQERAMLKAAQKTEGGE